ncbi:MAG: ABC transporter permease [Xanthomonadales bacterium]|nr:ABC transporter permease [Xanthomonadales bacterium]
MAHWWTDIRQGVRLCLRNPLVNLAASGCLAIGIAAATLLHSAVSGLLLAPMPGLVRADQLVEIGTGQDMGPLSYPALRDLQQLPSLTGSWGSALATINLVANGQTSRGTGLLVSGSYFPVTGASLAAGRGLGPQDDAHPGQADSVVISYALWQGRLAQDPQILGRELVINGRSFRVIGVTAPDFHGHLGILEPDYYLPLSAAPLLGAHPISVFEARDSSWLQVGGRLAEGASVEQLGVELGVLAERHGAASNESSKPLLYRSTPLTAVPAFVNEPVSAIATILGVMIALLMAVACANVASVMLAAGERRVAELGLRTAIGAGKWRLLAQMLTESLPLALFSALLGLSLAWLCRYLLQTISLPVPINLRLQMPFSAPVIAGALLLTVATVLLASLYPAIRNLRQLPRMQMSGLAAGSVGGRRWPTRIFLLVQVSISVSLIASAGLMSRSLQQATSVDPGFQLEGLWSAEFDLSAAGLEPDAAVAFAKRAQQQLALIPGVDGVGLSRVLPLSLANMSLGAFQADGTQLTPSVNLVDEHYFQTLGMRITGRGIASQDDANAEPVVVINQSLARALFGQGPALGQQIDWFDGEQTQALRVVGIAADGRETSLATQGAPFAWLPVAQQPSNRLHLMIRSRRPLAELNHSVAVELHTLDSMLPPPNLEAMREVSMLSLIPQRLANLLSSLLGSIGLLISGIGLYAMLSLEAAQRTREMGLRLALGARSAQLGRLLLRQGLMPVALGSVIGLVLAGLLGNAMRQLLIGVSPGDPAVALVTVALLGSVAALACAGPLRRILHLQPQTALRQ